MTKESLILADRTQERTRAYGIYLALFRVNNDNANDDALFFSFIAMINLD